MNIINNLEKKAIYRVTGTPENFLTALRFGVWGFNEKNRNSWEGLNTGDILFFHSKGSDSKFIEKPIPSVLGFGIVGNHFYIDNTLLWIDEFKDGNRYPYRFAFSEIYFFQDIPVDDTWDSQSLNKEFNTRNIIKIILNSAIPLSFLTGFPHMGSYSSIGNIQVKTALLENKRKLFLYKGIADKMEVSKSTKVTEINNPGESIRYSTSLTIFDDIKKRASSSTTKKYSIDLETLSNVGRNHYEIITHLTKILKDKNYLCFQNSHVDLFAYKGNSSLLIEAKSIESNNFIPQSRKGIIKLFENNYFEISKFKNEKSLRITNENKVLATSSVPPDKEYISFINSFDIKTISVSNDIITPYGKSIDIAAL